MKRFYPILMKSFAEWLARYCNRAVVAGDDFLIKIASNCDNDKIYGDLVDEETYIQAILDFISGMTDRFAIKVYNELLTY